MPYDVEHNGGNKCTLTEGASGDRPGDKFSREPIPCNKAYGQKAIIERETQHTASPAAASPHAHPKVAKLMRYCASCCGTCKKGS